MNTEQLLFNVSIVFTQLRTTLQRNHRSFTGRPQSQIQSAVTTDDI